MKLLRFGQKIPVPQLIKLKSKIMNFLSRVLKFSMFVIVLFIYSCSKEENDTPTTLISNEIEKVVTIYKEGDVKIEVSAQPGIPKIETQASESYKSKIRKMLEQSYSKQTTYLKSGSNLVGVIKVKGQTCGSYAVLRWFMDCEDTPQTSSITGNPFSDFSVNSAGNITMQFCAVNGAYFERSSSNYAVLNLFGSASWPYEVDRIIVTLDNEDNRNANSGSYGATNWATGTTHWVGDSRFYYDTSLSFYYYRSTTINPKPMPILNIKYGVFGQIGSVQQRVYSDDEDNDNINYIGYQVYDRFNYRLGASYDVSGVANVVNQWENTEFFISQVAF